MRRIFVLLVISVAFFFGGVPTAKAIVDPLTPDNNPFGIHILDESDLEDAAKLVNSSGGNWGYVTLVIRADERDSKRWQSAFNKMRELHLIPIVRIATKMSEDSWEKPNLDELDGWVSFLSELNWVTQNRYIIIGNEPNHAKEWGGEVKPDEYAKYLETFSKKLKEGSKDFFILSAGFDASAPNGKETMSENDFLTKMISNNPNVFENVDGWSSHSYPNPNFSGSQDDEGRGTVKTFEWELRVLKNLGVTKTLPVFITETGWIHDKGGEKSGPKEVGEVATRLKASYELAWNDERIVAITPFVLNYQDPPFDIFSWKRQDGNFYQFYYEVKDLPKSEGKPKQIVAVDVLTLLFPPLIPNSGWMTGIIALKNTGQSIWEGTEKIYASYHGFEIIIEPRVLFSDIKPGERTLAVIKIKLFK
ncbi:hypothetical protein A2715_06175 [Candidatus Woesebacteria bacterium RIFCSPHIGHO2_01_FULL_39_32]|uniref:Uncharacterized protein n=2 Tax=Candidatus Woeseibacteriota TaxID=1752722 RepID=A0A0G0S4L7_9BACT|nr:MAG: hypothetical protein UT61_C0026G0012 [Candidatus Woesebacteria bacterium GW2011_GWA1_39_8]OGM25593.1 MAG: hypothetical protein A2715_06175 [Candidatus Woesebacteria bacterium RIFCSPHIGHO2_01_FULL_39_32]OGM36872.1 MAG: hypothetical protein A3F01_00650 [Candidatus Woesebacteria bacterium RIFCSPHIGHO2_12_FULL_38_11]OGM65124.1 MAG: hypothetical protein A2893_05785 [Candidatus Woesebacteria bacterium RIFCSPLOWO2_01_FULL_39_25]